MHQLRTALEQLANNEMVIDDPKFDPTDWYKGDADDAYYRGMKDGEIGLARTLIAILKGDDEEE